VAYNVGDVDEIGTSDVSAYVNQVRQILGAWWYWLIFKLVTIAN
jgi:hypothetical protein